MPRRRSPRLPALLLLLFGSGCAALIYEVVWFQLLQLAIGSSGVSLGTLLGTFMGGMCLGSLLAPRLVRSHWHPLRVYAMLELGLGAIALILLVAMPLVSRLYAATGGAHVAFRVIAAGVCLLPATILMGATFPVIARWVDARASGISWLGFFYGANLAGAVIGSLLAGFYLLRLYDVNVATYVAAGLNIGVAIGSLAIASQAPYRATTPEAHVTVETRDSARVYFTIAISGLTALSCEVLWTRLLSLALGGTVYTFSLILAAFLVGLGLGGGLGAALVRTRLRPRAALGWCQILLCGAMFWGAYVVTAILPYWPVAASVRSDPWLNLQSDLVRCLLVVLPGAILWGASFPLALAAVAPGQEPGRLVGRVYAANTVGAIAGSLGASLILVAYLGSQRAQQSLIVISACAGLMLLNSEFRIPNSELPRRARRLTISLVVVASAGAALLAWIVPPVPDVLIAYGRRSAEVAGVEKFLYAGKILHVGEGLNAFVAVSRGSNGELNYHAAGKVQASTRADDMRLQRLLAHISHLIPKHPSNVLVIGCGAGVTAGAISIGPGVEHMTIAEIESLVPAVASTYFGDYNYHVLDNPKVTIRIDDGRHFLLTTSQKFDVITTDMIDPWVKGVATLFTREFFETAKQHLRSGGVVTHFVQLYQSNREAVKSEIATFVEAFPHAVIWGNPTNGQGYDLVLMGTAEPLQIDIDELQARLETPQYARVAESLRAIGISSAVQLLSSYAGSGTDLAPWLQDAAINRDRNLRLQYLAGMGLNIDVDLADTAAAPTLWLAPEVAVDPPSVQVEQVWYPSKDGTKISMFLARKVGLARTGSIPTLLLGYGAFGASLTPTFSPAFFQWFEAGGLLAVPNVRGGGEYGPAWHEAGSLDKKQNTIDDFVAAAEWLAANKYTNPQRLAIYGGEHGAVLAGAVLTQRPDLFRAVVARVPVLDMLRYQHFLSGPSWVPEYGSAENADQFRWLLAYSPYQHVRPGTKYPAVLLTALEDDPSVHALHARKMAAALQAATASSPSDHPILLRVDRATAQDPDALLNLQLRDVVDQRLFIMWQLGML